MPAITCDFKCSFQYNSLTYGIALPCFCSVIFQTLNLQPKFDFHITWYNLDEDYKLQFICLCKSNLDSSCAQLIWNIRPWQLGFSGHSLPSLILAAGFNTVCVFFSSTSVFQNGTLKVNILKQIRADNQTVSHQNVLKVGGTACHLSLLLYWIISMGCVVINLYHQEYFPALEMELAHPCYALEFWSIPQNLLPKSCIQRGKEKLAGCSGGTRDLLELCVYLLSE